jgi:hypothetical protein
MSYLKILLHITRSDGLGGVRNDNITGDTQLGAEASSSGRIEEMEGGRAGSTGTGLSRQGAVGDQGIGNRAEGRGGRRQLLLSLRGVGVGDEGVFLHVSRSNRVALGLLDLEVNGVRVRGGIQIDHGQ